MSKLKLPKVPTTDDDDFLYNYLINLLQQIKLVRGGNELAFTLRNHSKIKDYLTSKQIYRLNFVEDNFFSDDGLLDSVAIQNHFIKNRTLQNN